MMIGDKVEWNRGKEKDVIEGTITAVHRKRIKVAFTGHFVLPSGLPYPIPEMWFSERHGGISESPIKHFQPVGHYKGEAGYINIGAQQ